MGFNAIVSAMQRISGQKSYRIHLRFSTIPRLHSHGTASRKTNGPLRAMLVIAQLKASCVARFSKVLSMANYACRISSHSWTTLAPEYAVDPVKL